MAVYSTTTAGAQDGSAFAGVWDDAAFVLPVSVGVTTGLQFVVHTEFDAEGRPLDPALIYPSFDLTLSVNLALSPGTVDISFVPEAAPQPYSNLLLPGARDEVALVSVDVAMIDTTTVVTVPTVLMVEYLRSSDWNGIISLTLEGDFGLLASVSYHSADGPDPTLAPTATTIEVPFHTGEWDGPAFGRRARTRHCPRTGMPVASDHMIRDGYVDGMMVSAEGWEPVDPEDKYAPSPLEGVVDDEV